MYNVHLTHSLLCFEFVEFTLNKIAYSLAGASDLACQTRRSIKSKNSPPLQPSGPLTASNVQNKHKAQTI